MTHVTKIYGFNGLAGCVDQWTSRDTGTLVSVYNAEQAGLEHTVNTAWYTVCETHGNMVGTRSRMSALRTRSPLNFCDDCQTARAALRFDVSVIEWATDEVVKVVASNVTEAHAEHIERGLLINMNREEYGVRITPHAAAEEAVAP